MKRLTGDMDYLCIVGKPSDITSNLNRVAALYDLTVLSSTMKDDGFVMVIIERRKKENPSSEPITI